MEIRITTDKNSWNNWFFNQQTQTPFTQSWEWGEILISEGKKVERLAVVENGEVVAQAQVVYTSVLLGWQYAFCPKGLVFDEVGSKNYEERICETLVKFFNKKNIIFLRIEPSSIVQNSKNKIQKTIDINPSATLILDLSKGEAQLLEGMHQKTRYNIRLAEKKDLEVKQDKNLEVFWNLMNKTGSRDKFGLHHKDHYAKVLTSESSYQLTAYIKDVPVACAVFFRFGNVFTYLYGASDYEYRNLMAPYLLQWEGVKLGRQLGCAVYDFFGVAPKLKSRDPSAMPQDEKQESGYEYDQKHQYAGVTRFKLGFGGVSQEMPGTFDLIIKQKNYLFYNLLRKLRRLL